MFGIASVFSASVRIEGKKLFVDIVTNIVGLFEMCDQGQIEVGEVQVLFHIPRSRVFGSTSEEKFSISEQMLWNSNA